MKLIKIMILILGYLFLNTTQVVGYNKEFVIKFTNDKLTKRVSKNLKFYLIENGKDIELKKISDSANTFKYSVPDLPDSLITKLTNQRNIKIRVKHKRKCFETTFFNMIISKYDQMEIEIKRNTFNRRDLIFIQTQGIKGYCPAVYRCGDMPN